MLLVLLPRQALQAVWFSTPVSCNCAAHTCPGLSGACCKSDTSPSTAQKGSSPEPLLSFSPASQQDTPPQPSTVPAPSPGAVTVQSVPHAQRLPAPKPLSPPLCPTPQTSAEFQCFLPLGRDTMTEEQCQTQGSCLASSNETPAYPTATSYPQGHKVPSSPRPKPALCCVSTLVLAVLITCSLALLGPQPVLLHTDAPSWPQRSLQYRGKMLLSKEKHDRGLYHHRHLLAPGSPSSAQQGPCRTRSASHQPPRPQQGSSKTIQSAAAQAAAWSTPAPREHPAPSLNW